MADSGAGSPRLTRRLVSFPSCTSSEFNFGLGCWVITPRAGTPPIAILLYHLSPAGVGGINLADKEQGFNETVCRVCFLSFVCAQFYPAHNRLRIRNGVRVRLCAPPHSTHSHPEPLVHSRTLMHR